MQVQESTTPQAAHYEKVCINTVSYDVIVTSW